MERRATNDTANHPVTKIDHQPEERSEMVEVVAETGNGKKTTARTAPVVTIVILDTMVAMGKVATDATASHLVTRIDHQPEKTADIAEMVAETEIGTITAIRIAPDGTTVTLGAMVAMTTAQATELTLVIVETGTEGMAATDMIAIGGSATKVGGREIEDTPTGVEGTMEIAGEESMSKIGITDQAVVETVVVTAGMVKAAEVTDRPFQAKFFLSVDNFTRHFVDVV